MAAVDVRVALGVRVNGRRHGEPGLMRLLNSRGRCGGGMHRVGQGASHALLGCVSGRGRSCQGEGKESLSLSFVGREGGAGLCAKARSYPEGARCSHR